MDLESLLRAWGPPIWSSRIKLVRHADFRFDLASLHRKGLLYQYEGHQGRPVFQGCEYLLSFLGEGGSRSRFIGCRKVLGVETGPRPHPPGFPYPDMELGTYWYELEPVPGFEDLEDRLIVDWGKGTRSWVQWLDPRRPRQVLELLPEAPPAGQLGPFPGYESVILTFADLQCLFENPAANRDWHLLLGAVAGIYLITDTRQGELYVGSAGGEGGIAARWACYARTGHGGNALMRALLESDPERVQDFQFSVLGTLPLSITPSEIVAIESRYKRKLGSRAHGLNAN